MSSPAKARSARRCPYCSSDERKPFGVRLRATFVRCAACGSIFMDLSDEEFERLHAEAFSDDTFVDDIASERAAVPAFGTWDQFSNLFPAGPLLELGPGSGHFLAAARARGREVFGVESSASHRDFITKTWGIERVFAGLGDLPSAQRFGAIVLFNTIEHVYDVHGLMSALRGRLEPGGAILLSTANAGCVIVPIVGPYWSMFKQVDHVSIPSAEGFRQLAQRTGLRADRVWTGELPLETPIGLAVAARDFVKERLMHRQPATAQVAHAPRGASAVPLGRRLARGIMRATATFDPTRYVTSRLGVAASVKGLFRNVAAAQS